MDSHRIRLIGTALVLSCATAGVSAASIAATATRRTEVGSRLVNRFFLELKHHDVAALRHFLSSAFQIQRANGMRLTKAEYLHNLPDVIGYELRDFRTTSTQRVVVVSYQARTLELIDGKKVESPYAPRLSAFSHTAQGWQLAAHANFNPPA